MSMIDHLSIILWGKSANEPARAEALADPSKKARSLNGWRTLQTLKRGCQEGRAGKAVDPSPPSPRLRDRLEVYRPYGVRGCLPPARHLLHPAPRAAARQTIVTTAKETRGCLLPTPRSLLRSAPRAAARQTIVSSSKETQGCLLPTPRSLLRSAPRAEARQTIVTTAKETRGCLLPTPRSLLQPAPRATPRQTPSYPLTTKVRRVERPPNLPEREKKKTPTGGGTPTSKPPRSRRVGSWEKGKPRTHIADSPVCVKQTGPSSGLQDRQKSATPACQAVPAPRAALRLDGRIQQH
jgi:hypothetical protein